MSTSDLKYWIRVERSILRLVVNCFSSENLQVADVSLFCSSSLPIEQSSTCEKAPRYLNLVTFLIFMAFCSYLPVLGFNISLFIVQIVVG